MSELLNAGLLLGALLGFIFGVLVGRKDERRLWRIGRMRANGDDVEVWMPPATPSDSGKWEKCK